MPTTTTGGTEISQLEVAEIEGVIKHFACHPETPLPLHGKAGQDQATMKAHYAAYNDMDVYRAATRVSQFLFDADVHTRFDWSAVDLELPVTFTADLLDKFPAKSFIKVWFSHPAAAPSQITCTNAIRIDHGGHPPLSGTKWIGHVHTLVSALYSKETIAQLFRDCVAVNPEFFIHSPDFTRYEDERRQLQQAADIARERLAAQQAELRAVLAEQALADAREQAARDAVADLTSGGGGGGGGSGSGGGGGSGSGGGTGTPPPAAINGVQRTRDWDKVINSFQSLENKTYTAEAFMLKCGELLMRMDTKNVPVGDCCEALLRWVSKFNAEYAFLSSKWASLPRDTLDERRAAFRKLFRTARYQLLKVEDTQLPVYDKRALQRMNLAPNESLSHLILRLKWFKRVIDATYTTAEVAAVTRNFDEDAAECVRNAIMTNTSRFSNDIRLIKQNPAAYTWARFQQDYASEPIVVGMSDAPIADTSPPVVIDAGSDTRPNPEEPQPMMQATGRISSEVVQELQPVFNKVLERCDRIDEACAETRELAVQAKQAAEEAQQGQSILRQVITTRLGTDVFPAEPANAPSQIAAAQAVPAVAPHTPPVAPTNRPPITPRPPPAASSFRGGRGTAFGGRGGGGGRVSFRAPPAASPPSNPVAAREPFTFDELPEPWSTLGRTLLAKRKGRGGSASILDDECLICPQPRMPHPTCKCSFLWLFTTKGQAWLRAREKSRASANQYLQQMQLADAYPNLDDEMHHVLSASAAIDEDQTNLEGIAAQILHCQQRGWHADEGSALIQCIQCMHSDTKSE